MNTTLPIIKKTIELAFRKLIENALFKLKPSPE